MALEMEGCGGTSAFEYITLFSSLPASSGFYLQVDSVTIEHYHFALRVTWVLLTLNHFTSVFSRVEVESSSRKGPGSTQTHEFGIGSFRG